MYVDCSDLSGFDVFARGEDRFSALPANDFLQPAKVKLICYYCRCGQRCLMGQESPRCTMSGLRNDCVNFQVEMVGHENLIGMFRCAVWLGMHRNAGLRGLGQRLSTDAVRAMAAAGQHQPVLCAAGGSRPILAGCSRALRAMRSLPEMHNELCAAKLLSASAGVRNKNGHGTSHDHAN